MILPVSLWILGAIALHCQKSLNCFQIFLTEKLGDCHKQNSSCLWAHKPGRNYSLAYLQLATSGLLQRQLTSFAKETLGRCAAGSGNA